MTRRRSRSPHTWPVRPRRRSAGRFDHDHLHGARHNDGKAVNVPHQWPDRPGGIADGHGTLMAVIAFPQLEVVPSSGEIPRGRRWISTSPTWQLWLAVVAVVCGVHVMYPDGVLGNVTYLSITGGAAVVAWIGARQRDQRWRFAWGCVALGVTSSAAGDAIYYVRGLIDGALLNVSIADAFWITAYIALAVGLSSVIVGGHGFRRFDVDGLIDIASFVVLALVVVTHLGAVQDVINDASYTMSTRAVWTAYPILDAALLGVVAHAMLSRRLRGSSGIFLGLGAALWLTSDFTSLIFGDNPAIHRWLDIGWMIGAVGLAISTRPTAAIGAAHESSLVNARLTNGRIFVTLLPLLVPGLIEIWRFRNGHAPSPVPLFAATVVLVLLAFARSTRLLKARNRQEAELQHRTRFYAALAENSSDAVIVVDEAGYILNDAPNLAAMLGRPGVLTKGLDAVDLLQPHDRDAARRVLARWWLTSGVVDDAEVRATQADGSERWFGVRAANLSTDPAVGGMVINLRDISDRKRAEVALSHSGFHDPVTGLANRALFHDRLEHALDRTARSGLGVAVVYLDLDGFKMVNDSRGHEAGDQVLREVATRLTRAVRSLDTVSRTGGDEFAILIEESVRVLDEAETVAERVLQSLTEPFDVDGQHIVLSASIGIAIGDVSCTESSMMRDADVAMYKAKTTGKAQWTVYEPEMRTAALDRLELESDLHQAVDEHQLRLMYQPIIELKSDNIVGFEALLRWDHPTRGVIEPERFIPIAESSGTIVAIGRWVLQEACRAAADWKRTFPSTKLTMAVNISARQLAASDIVGDVANALVRSGFPATKMILEMTESVLVQDPGTATRRLEDLRALGVRVAIDDFGTGYSSLSYLRQFPIDILKIDKSFTDTIVDRTQIPPIVHGLLALAKTLDMHTVAEGIESEVQRDSLREQGCEFGQGYLFAKPLDAADVVTLLAGRRTSVTVPIGL
jgi:diguanylate cyclase (GGDEF)-like protein/PAS domain S-box-containing protein